MTILNQLAEHAKERVSEAKKRLPESELKRQAEAMKKGGFSMEGSAMFPPHHVPADSPFVQTLLQCYTDVTGKPGKAFAIGGGTYVHHLKNGVAFGCADLEIDNRMHGADEFVEIECLKQCVVIFAEAILRICGE